MIKPQIPTNEKERLEALKSYSILDSLPEKEFEDITLLASQICETPISLISLVDDKRQWFKSNHGLDLHSTEKEIAFCAHAINDQDNIMIVPDSRLDERFFDNPLVLDDPHVIFYAGIPLINPEGYALGTLCVVDHKPKILKESQIKALKVLSNQLLKLLELRKNNIALEMSNHELKSQNKGLNEFAKVAAHDIKSPIGNIIQLTDLLKSDHSTLLNEEGQTLIQHIHTSANKLTTLIDGILTYSKDSQLITKNKEKITIDEIVHEIIELVDGSHQVKFELNIAPDLYLFTNKTALQQIIVNLLTNSIKYNDKTQTIIKLSAEQKNHKVHLHFEDNGLGIHPSDIPKIFNLFHTTMNKDHNGLHGTGIGLATVKTLVESLGGNITVSSEWKQSTHFEITMNKD